MAVINGTESAETLAGTAGDDTIKALGGNDTVNAGDGNDTIFGGLGNDTLNGENGDDTFVEDQVTASADVFNGGSGFDTVELRALPTPVIGQSGPTSTHSFSSNTTLNSIERIVFGSQAGEVVQGVMLNTAVTASGLTTIVGGAGRDLMVFLTGPAAGTFAMPNLTYSGFSTLPTNTWESPTSDALILAANVGDPNVAVTLNAIEGLNVVQFLSGGAGNDTLNGSSNSDVLNGGTGANTLNGNGGNDTLIIANQYSPNGQGGFNAPANLTGLGSTLNGGSGTDVLSVGGTVQLAATLVSIEGIHLQPAFAPPVANTPGQYEAHLVLDSAHAAMLPGNAFFAGTGVVEFNIDDGASFSLANYTFSAGSSVQFQLYAGDGNALTFTGSSAGDFIQLGGGNQTAIGGGGNDTIRFGGGNQIATGGSGADTFSIGAGTGTITDFTIGTDKLDFTDTGISNVGRLNDLTGVQVGSSVSISAQSGGETYEVILQNTLLTNLSAADAILDTGGRLNIDYGTQYNDLLFGFEQNDVLHGGTGNDRLYGGGGVDDLRGEDGDDTIVLDGAIQFGGTYLGGNGFDTLLLRSYNANSFYSVFGTVGGIERVDFDSKSGESLGAAIAFANIAGGLTTVRGGDGGDVMNFIVTAAGSYNLNNLTLQNWTTSVTSSAGGDTLAITASASMTAGVTLTARTDISNQALIGAKGGDTLVGSNNADFLRGNDGSDTILGGGGNDQLYGDSDADQLTGGQGNDSIDGGSNVDTAIFAGNRGAYTISQPSTGTFTITGPDGTDTLVNVEYAKFDDQTIRLYPGQGTNVNFATDNPATYMTAIRDFDGNDVGNGAGWKLIGAADVNGDGDVDRVFVNKDAGRFAEVGTAPDGKVYFSDHGWAGETRVVGIYIDPLVQSGQVVAGSDHDSQRRFQNDLRIDNIKAVLGAADYDHNGLQEVYFSLTDGTAFLHAYMHADGNIQYANYQSQQQVIDYLTQNGWASSTYAGWFG